MGKFLAIIIFEKRIEEQKNAGDIERREKNEKKTVRRMLEWKNKYHIIRLKFRRI